MEIGTSVLILLSLQFVVLACLSIFFVYQWIIFRHEMKEFFDWCYSQDIFRARKNIERIQQGIAEIGKNGVLGGISQHLYSIDRKLTEELRRR